MTLQEKHVSSWKCIFLQWMPWMASPLSSSFIGNFTWSYIFIHHMICVLLGASIYFVRIFFLLFKTMFCIFYFKKVALIAFTMPMLQVYMLLFENRKFTAVAIIPQKSQNVINVETFCILRYDKFNTVGIFFHNFWSQGSMDLLHSLQTVLFR